MIWKGYHLSYCTNIHPGESWGEVFETLQQYVPEIKEGVSPREPFGIGLRLSNKASLELVKEKALAEFKEWLQRNDCYVFTFNGFPYGGFHRQVVKDEVHQPDWSTKDRLEYTLRLFHILENLLPEGMDGGISTSPISYRYWHKTPEALEEVKRIGTQHLAEVAAELYRIRQRSGKELHLDIEPEPDGLLENTAEVGEYYREWLIPQGGKYLEEKLGLSREEAEKCLKDHIRICYDVCHFAVVYEKPADVFAALASEGIKVGKIQISAALKLDLPENNLQRQEAARQLSPFVESTYLHQVVARDDQGRLTSYPDLPFALETLQETQAREWRTHFHVPVFLDSYGKLASTQKDILEVLELLRKEKVTQHLEVETYTWEVLPKDIQLSLAESIKRELRWVQENLD